MIRNALAEEMGPVLLFAPRRKAAEQLATEIAAALPPCAPLPLSDAQVHLAGRQLSKLLRARVAFHHSGLSFAQRAQLVEPLAKAGQLRVVVATMGLAAGINFSMRSVAVSGTTYMVGGSERKVSAAELLQMFGRAGRRGLDETGYALVSQHPPRLHDAQPLPLRRSAQLDWTTLLAVMHHATLRREPPYSSRPSASTAASFPRTPCPSAASIHSTRARVRADSPWMLNALVFFAGAPCRCGVVPAFGRTGPPRRRPRFFQRSTSGQSQRVKTAQSRKPRRRKVGWVPAVSLSCIHAAIWFRAPLPASRTVEALRQGASPRPA
jgi:hypothetical protein